MKTKLVLPICTSITKYSNLSSFNTYLNIAKQIACGEPTHPNTL